MLGRVAIAPWHPYLGRPALAQTPSAPPPVPSPAPSTPKDTYSLQDYGASISDRLLTVLKGVGAGFALGLVRYALYPSMRDPKVKAGLRKVSTYVIVSGGVLGGASSLVPSDKKIFDYTAGGGGVGIGFGLLTKVMF